MTQIILASSSGIRQMLLTNAGVPFTALPARIDEDAIKAALLAEDATPRDVADALAEFKARKIAEKHPEATVIGTDQVLEFQGQILSKPASREEAAEQLRALRGKRHKLLSAVVVYSGAEPVWRYVGQVRLLMREISEDYLAGLSGSKLARRRGQRRWLQAGRRRRTAFQPGRRRLLYRSGSATSGTHRVPDPKRRARGMTDKLLLAGGHRRPDRA